MLVLYCNYYILKGSALMTIEELNVKIEQKKADIEKRKALTVKMEKKIEEAREES
jgi:hypothetical protein